LINSVLKFKDWTIHGIPPYTSRSFSLTVPKFNRNFASVQNFGTVCLAVQIIPMSKRAAKLSSTQSPDI
jgi:hypothetical protein